MKDFNGAILSGREWLNMEQAHLNDYRVIGVAADANSCAYMPNGPETFDVARVNADILARKADILKYAQSGTLIRANGV